MSIFFAFSDENGVYKKSRSEKFINAHPFYIRATYLMLASEWKNLSKEFLSLKDKYGLPKTKEIKWSYIWQVRRYQKKNAAIPIDKPFYFLRDIDYHHLISFVEDSIGLLGQLQFFKVIYTVTFNFDDITFDELKIYEMHLQDHLQRIELELKTTPIDDNNLCVIFVDPVSSQINKLLKNAYNSLFINGDYYLNYKHVIDTISFVDSHHSIGIQLADYLGGIFSGYLKEYSKSVEIFNNKIKPFLRTDKKGGPFGYGIMEVPTNKMIRSPLKNIFLQ